MNELKNSQSFKKLMEYLDYEILVEKAVKLSETQIDQMINWEILEEERLEAKILIWLDDQRKKMFDRFDNDFTPAYSKTAEEAVNFLSTINLEPRKKYKQVGIFRFHKYTIPTECKEWFQKQDTGKEIEVLSEINDKTLREILEDTMIRAFYAGGQSTFTILQVGLSFNLLDKDAEQRLKTSIAQLSSQVSSQIQSSIQLELLEGVRNFESIPQLRDRILRVWNNPIEVNVPPKLADGKVIRAGYSYNLSAEQWATTVARTEVARSFQLGRIDAYKQSGLITSVQHQVSPDERLCNICAPLAGEIYTIEEAQTVFPLHPSCRCTPIPIIDYSGDRNISDVMEENISDAYDDLGLI